MDAFVEAVAVVALVGVACQMVLAPGVGIVMGLLLVVGVIDGPSGGRLEARRGGK